MKGKYKIIIQNKKIKYEFEIRRNITVIRGDSATGKTTLVDMVREYYENGINSGIQLNSAKECAVLEGRNWKTQLKEFSDSILFIDEGNEFVTSKDFAAEIQNTDNYYVIVSRERLSTLPYSVEEIYGIRTSGKYGSLKQTFNEFFRIYSSRPNQITFIPQTVITEDSHSGFQFFEAICKERRISCISANGKSNILGVLEKQSEQPLLIIADGAAFGSEMELVTEALKNRKHITLYVPESFEWLILKSGVVKDSEISEILSSPYDYIESADYFSWERFFTELLIKKTADSFLKYSKKNINEAYTQKNIADKILAAIPNILFETQDI